MKIGIVVYSQTGNTLSIAEKLRDKLLEQGAAAEILRVTVEGGDYQSKTPLKLIETPDPCGFDAVVFASPVQAFSLAQAMVLYFRQMPPFEAKKVLFFTTQQLKKPWLGANHAIRQAKTMILAKGAILAMSGSVQWSSEKREEQIAALIDRFAEELK